MVFNIPHVNYILALFIHIEKNFRTGQSLFVRIAFGMGSLCLSEIRVGKAKELRLSFRKISGFDWEIFKPN